MTDIDGLVVLVEPVHADERGWFREVWKGMHLPFVPRQINASVSRRGVVRGLHLQYDPPMGKLMTVLAGRALLVAVDANPHSRTYRAVDAREVGPEDGIAVYAPAHCARGFAALDDNTVVAYACDAEYGGPKGELAIRWNDPTLAVPWPDYGPLGPDMSVKDRNAEPLDAWAPLLWERFLPDRVSGESVTLPAAEAGYFDWRDGHLVRAEPVGPTFR